jgi:hypothetical protein
MSVIYGQTGGSLSGKVSEASGVPVPSASITVTDPGGFAHTATTAQDGTFTINNLPAGNYRIDVQVTGFKRLTQENVQVTAGAPVSLQLGLEAGSSQESVAIQGQAPLADDSSDRIAHSYSGNVLGQLPVQDLNYSQLVEMSTGVTPPTPTTNILLDPQRNRAWNTNGQQAQSNNFFQDGIENQENVRNQQIHIPTIEGIQQMNLTTSNYDASQGRAAGSILNPITKPGASTPHGEIFEYHSNDWLRARNFFNPSPLPQPIFTSNQFGADLGGAIIPDRTFFFVSDQSDIVRDANPVFTTVPSAAFIQGNFSSLPGVTIYNPFTGSTTGAGRTPFSNNIIPSNLLNSSAVALLSALPAPNLAGVENNYYTNQQFRNTGIRGDARLDQRFNDRNLVFLRYGLSYYSTRQASALGVLGESGGYSRLRAHEGLVGYTHAFGATTFTDLRAGFDRYSNPIYGLPGVTNAAAFGFSGSAGIPNVAIDGMQNIGTNPAYPQINKEDNWNIVNNWTFRIRNNDFRFGADYYQVRADGFQNLLYGPAGGYTFTSGATSIPGASLGQYGSFANSLAAFLLGVPTTSGVNTSAFLPSYISRQYGLYAADRVNIMSHLTLDLGVRWDLFLPVEPRNNAANYFTFNPGVNTLTSLGSGSRSGGVTTNNMNVAPRIGLAYRVRDRLVVRAGYGMSFWNPELAFFANSLMPAMTGTTAGIAGGYTTTGRFGVLPLVTGAAAVAPNQTLYVTPSKVRTPYVQFFNFDIQQDMSHGMLLDLAYVGNLGRDLPYTRDLNAAAPGSGANGQPFGVFGHTAPILLRGTGMSSNYNSLQANVTKRFSQGFAFTAAYTFSKSLDYGAGLTPFLYNNNPFANYGPSNFDRTHIFTFTHAWRLPFGPGTGHFNHGLMAHLLGPWELDGIARTATGLPFTPTASSALCQCPGNTPTANVVPGPTLNGVTFVPGFYGFYYFALPYELPTIALAQPSAGALGNIGRNAIRANGFTNYDLALSRSFVFFEHTRLDFRAEAYNLTNSPHFGPPIANVNSSNFGLSTTTAPGLDNRIFQFAVKLVF